MLDFEADFSDDDESIALAIDEESNEKDAQKMVFLWENDHLNSYVSLLLITLCSCGQS